jgi:hypothetical protein
MVTCLAAMLGFRACGIELEPPLVAEARRFVALLRVPVRFVQGSYLPPGAFAAPGAILVTYHGGSRIQVLRNRPDPPSHSRFVAFPGDREMEKTNAVLRVPLS